MTYLFSRETAPTLAKVLSSRVLLAFDFDGTLAPIVAERSAARMRRRTHQLLARLCPLYPFAVISGRRQDDVVAKLEGLPIRHVLGNHGIDADCATNDLAAHMAVLRGKLADTFSDGEGIDVEDKIYSLAVHYRRAPNRARARASIERVLTAFDGPLRVIPGKQVYDIVDAEAPHKGDALARVRAAEDADAVIYFGDDTTDEDVFRSAEAERLLSIRVGHSRRSAAAYFIRDQRELDVFLAYAARVRA